MALLGRMCSIGQMIRRIAAQKRISSASLGVDLRNQGRHTRVGDGCPFTDGKLAAVASTLPFSRQTHVGNGNIIMKVNQNEGSSTNSLPRLQAR